MKDIIRQGLGTSRAIFGTNGRTRLTWLYSLAAIAVLVGTVNILDVISFQQNVPGRSVWEPVILEGSSWLSLMLFVWVPWIGWRIAPPALRSRWALLLHIPASAAFTLLHVGGFDVLRVGLFGLAGRGYRPGAFLPHYLFELRKDVLAYVMFVGLFSLIDHLLRRPGEAPRAMPQAATTFDIRDGARLTRVLLEDILAITSAGNYVEFLLADGRRLLMRSALQAMEAELAPRGFLRTHRSWLVNAAKVTALRPEGSGDYAVELGSQSVPLSRRFPGALAKLRSDPTAAPAP